MHLTRSSMSTERSWVMYEVRTLDLWWNNRVIRDTRGNYLTPCKSWEPLCPSPLYNISALRDSHLVIITRSSGSYYFPWKLSPISVLGGYFSFPNVCLIIEYKCHPLRWQVRNSADLCESKCSSCSSNCLKSSSFSRGRSVSSKSFGSRGRRREFVQICLYSL